MSSDKPIAYEVTNRQTGQVRRFKTSKGASAYMDRADWTYGAVCTTRRAIWA